MDYSESVKDLWTVRRILGWTTGYLESKGCETPRLDAEVLLGHCLNMSRVELYLSFERPLSNSERDSYRALVSRRAQREPVSLIIGRREFWSIPICVVPGVLVPRPDSETLVETALSEIPEFEHARILELGVGSGAVSIAIMKEREFASVIGVDINRLAIELSGKNALANKCLGRLTLLMADLMTAFRRGPLFEIILSNPPYIPTDSISCLAPEITRFDPVTALNGGEDGLDCIRKIVSEAPNFLAPGGRLILEIGDGQAEAVKSIIDSEQKYTSVTFHRDLTGTVRVVKACVP